MRLKVVHVSVGPSLSIVSSLLTSEKMDFSHPACQISCPLHATKVLPEVYKAFTGRRPTKRSVSGNCRARSSRYYALRTAGCREQHRSILNGTGAVRMAPARHQIILSSAMVQIRSLVKRPRLTERKRAIGQGAYLSSSDTFRRPSSSRF